MYKSPELQVTRHSIEGHIMKAVENVGFFNASEYHKRFIRLEFGGKGELMFFEHKPEQEWRQSLPYKNHK